MTEEGSSSKLDSLSQQDLIKLVKKYIVLQKHLKQKNEELTSKIDSLEKSKPAEDSNQSSGDDTAANEILQLKKQLDELTNKLNEANGANASLSAEKTTLLGRIEELDKQIVEYETYKSELEPQLETARHEIEMNKSMLNMLNNEIQCLNSEKLELEKKLLRKRGGRTPCVVIHEESEEESKEELSHHEETPESSGGRLETIEEDVGSNDDTSYSGQIIVDEKQIDRDEKTLSLSKQIEELTFYIDELKSDLEAEREKNNEHVNEIEQLKSQQSQPVTTIPPSSNDEAALLAYYTKLKTEFIDSDRLDGLREYLTREQTSQLIQQVNGVIVTLVHNYDQKVDKSSSELKDKTERIGYFEKQLEKVIQNYKEEMSQLEAKLKEKTSELDEFKTQSESKLKFVQNELDIEKDRYKNTISRLEKYEKEASKSKMLNLEMADYERSIKSLNLQLINKEKEIGDLKSELNSSNEKVAKLKQELETIEKERDDEREKSTKLKQLLVKAKKDVSDAKAQETEYLGQDAIHKAQLQSLNLDIENFKIQIADLSAERQKLHDKLHSQSDNNQRAMSILETKLKSTEDQLSDVNSKLSSMKLEYDNYKVKVQHAFKKQKEQSESNVGGMSSVEVQSYLNEIEQLKLLVTKLTDKLAESDEKVKLLEKEGELIQEEYSRSLERNTKLLTELKEKETEWKLRNQELMNDNTTKTDEAIELIKSLRDENESLSKTYKEKLKNLSQESNRTISLLQEQLDEAKTEIDRLNKYIDDLMAKSKHSSIATFNNLVNSRNIETTASHIPSTPSSDTSFNSNNFILGQNPESKSQDNGNSLNRTFEKLLNDSPVAISQTDSIELLAQMEQLKTDLIKSKKQLEHLNDLLNESELNNVRLTEQINVLKDEIRRLERNQEREKSISNMEYLKNVVLKFLTFSTPQEKAQLLPVLTTMLKLSQNEQNAVMNAKVVPINTNNESLNGWGSYLPKWST